jgi:hypothetical protein
MPLTDVLGVVAGSLDAGVNPASLIRRIIFSVAALRTVNQTLGLSSTTRALSLSRKTMGG